MTLVAQMHISKPGVNVASEKVWTDTQNTIFTIQLAVFAFLGRFPSRYSLPLLTIKLARIVQKILVIGLLDLRITFTSIHIFFAFTIYWLFQIYVNRARLYEVKLKTANAWRNFGTSLIHTFNAAQWGHTLKFPMHCPMLVMYRSGLPWFTAQFYKNRLTFVLYRG